MADERRVVDLGRTPARPTNLQIQDAMVHVTELMDEAWFAIRLGALYHFRHGDKTEQSRKHDFRDAVEEVTGLRVARHGE